MKRRQFLRMAAPLAAVPWPVLSRPLRFRSLEPDLSVVLRGGRWLDGGVWRSDDIAIDPSGRLRFGANLLAAETVDVTGKVIAPGPPTPPVSPSPRASTRIRSGRPISTPGASIPAGSSATVSPTST